MRKHISEVELCTGEIMGPCDCDQLHRDDFCLLCGYKIEGDRLYLEIHGPNGWNTKTRQIDSAQPYACMECAEQFKASRKHYPVGKDLNFLEDFIKEKKK